MDVEAVWNGLATPQHTPHAMTAPRGLREFGDLLLRAAPIVTRRDNDGITFEPHPRPNLAGPRNWAWIMPVRDVGVPCPEIPGIPPRLPDIRMQRLWTMAYGDLIDLIAVTPDFRRVIGRFTGLGVVLGFPQREDGLFDPAARVRVFRTVEGWLRGTFDGVVMIGSSAESADWLHNWPGGVICDDVEHGKAIDRLLRKPYAGPPVMVAA